MTTAGYSEPWLLWNGCRVGGHQHIEFAKSVGDGSAIEVGGALALGGIDIIDIANVGVVDVLVVVVLDLHDLVAGRKCPSESFDLSISDGIERSPAARCSTSARRYHPDSSDTAP